MCREPSVPLSKYGIIIEPPFPFGTCIRRVPDGSCISCVPPWAPIVANGRFTLLGSDVMLSAPLVTPGVVGVGWGVKKSVYFSRTPT